MIANIERVVNWATFFLAAPIRQGQFPFVCHPITPRTSPGAAQARPAPIYLPNPAPEGADSNVVNFVWPNERARVLMTFIVDAVDAHA